MKKQTSPRVCLALILISGLAGGTAWADTKHFWQHSSAPERSYAGWAVAAQVLQEGVVGMADGDTVQVSDRKVKEHED